MEDLEELEQQCHLKMEVERVSAPMVQSLQTTFHQNPKVALQDIQHHHGLHGGHRP